MIIVLKLVTGVDYICTLECTEADLIEAQRIEAIDPMSIDRDVEGMKLRDVLMLAENDKLIIRSKDIITYYYPTKQMVEYYIKALVYSKNYTKPSALQQIELAVQDIEAAMQEEDEASKRLVRMLMKHTGSTLQ